MKKFALIIAVSASFFMLSCKKDHVGDFNTNVNCTDTISFNTTILPLITDNCTSCHDSGNSTGYTLTNHTNISSSAAAVLNSMRGDGGFQQMPQDLPALPDSMIQKFQCWIAQGKLNN